MSDLISLSNTDFVITSLILLFIINKLYKMSQQLDALKATIADLEAQEQRAEDLLTTLVNNGKAAAENSAAIQAKLDQAIADLAAAGADTAALADITTDLSAHTATLKAAVDAATPA